MGCCSSKPSDAYTFSDVFSDDSKNLKDVVSVQAGQDADKTKSVVKPRLDPKDFQFNNLKHETKVKPPGTVNGQGFRIEGCHDCSLFLMDHCDQVMIESCTNCRIFIGPSSGSVYIRDSTSCKFAILCQQLRTFNTKNCSLLLFCRTKPVIETSKELKFGCYSWNYRGLAGHLAHSRLSPWTNFWSKIHDFTPAPRNFSLLDHGMSVEELLGPLPQEVVEAVGGPQGEAQLPVIPVWGERPRPGPHYMFALFPAAAGEAAASAFAAEALQQGGTVLRTNMCKVPAEHAGSIAAAAGWGGKAVKGLTAGSCIGMEVCASSAGEELQATASRMGALTTSNEAAGDMFCYLGVDG